jgi:hypothetical protein
VRGHIKELSGPVSKWSATLKNDLSVINVSGISAGQKSTTLKELIQVPLIVHQTWFDT